MTRCIANVGRSLRARCEPGEQRRLGRPESAVADPRHRAREEALPRALDEGVGGEPDREEPERGVEHPLASDAVDQRARDRAGHEADTGVRREDEPGDAEADPALVVQVDEQEREHEPVPERVHQPAHLKQLHRPRQPRVQAREEAQHRERVSTCSSCSTRTSSTSITAATAPARRRSSRRISASSATSSATRPSFWAALPRADGRCARGAGHVRRRAADISSSCRTRPPG